MSLKYLETKWRAALFSIMEHLEESEFQKLLFNLSKIPHGVKSDKTRSEIPKIIIQYFGTEGSISVIVKEMKQIPRMDADVQELLRPFVEKLKKQRQKNKGTTSKPATNSVAKRQKAGDGTTNKSASGSGSVAKRQKPEADHQKTCQPTMINPAGPSKPKQKKKKKKTDLTVTPAGSSTNPEINPVGPSKPKQKKRKKTDLTVTPAGSYTNPEINPAGPSKPKQKRKKADLTMTPAGSSTNTEINPVGPSKPKQKKRKKTDLTVTPAGSSTNPEINPAGPSRPKQKRKKKTTDLTVTPAGSSTNSEGPSAAFHPGETEEAQRNIFMVRQPTSVPPLFYCTEELWPNFWS